MEQVRSWDDTNTAYKLRQINIAEYIQRIQSNLESTPNWANVVSLGHVEAVLRVADQILFDINNKSEDQTMERLSGNDTARTAYQKRQSNIAEYIQRIQAKLVDDSKETITWASVGSLGYVETQLEIISEFLI